MKIFSFKMISKQVHSTHPTVQEALLELRVGVVDRPLDRPIALQVRRDRRQRPHPRAVGRDGRRAVEAVLSECHLALG